MNASKEECCKAIEKLETASRYAFDAGVGDHAISLLDSTKDFLKAALKRLPTEEAIARDNLRKAGYNANRKKKEEK